MDAHVVDFIPADVRVYGTPVEFFSSLSPLLCVLCALCGKFKGRHTSRG